MPDDFAPLPPPSRHEGSRTVNREPNIVRTITGVRNAVTSSVVRIKREEVSFTAADPARGEPAVAAAMTNVLVSRLYRSGHSIYVDVAVWLGVDSVMSAQLYVPDLDLTSPAITSGSGGEQDLRLQLVMPETWTIGADYRLYVQAMRVSGADSTTARVLRAWQR